MPEKEPDAGLENFDSVHREQWDFDHVPDAEIVACCLWEYARESETVQMRAELHWCHTRHITHRREYAANPELKAEHDKEAEMMEKRAAQRGFNYDAFSESLWTTDFPLIRIYGSIMDMVGGGAFRWQSLPQNVRTGLSDQVVESTVLRPLAEATVGELEELWKANSSDLIEVRARPPREHDESEVAALWEETAPVEPFLNEPDRVIGHLAAALTIDFSRFTDGEIAHAFHSWLKANRPAQWKNPKRVFPGTNQKGRKLLDYRVALERLGLMRLLHFYSPAMLSKELPEAWEKIRRKEKDFRREIREAAKFFRRLFPFLPENERPSSEERYGVWAPPLHRLIEEMDREGGIIPGRK